jgi:MFS family permease
MTATVKNYWIATIPKTVWVISIVTLLMNLSSIMIFTLSPLYLTQVLGLATIHLGLLEGLIELISWITRGFSGVVSDYLKKRKLLLVFAYTLTTISRPLFAIAPSIVAIYCAKLTDRISNGLQASPREALISDVAPKNLKGACYGFRQSLGVFGSLLGAASLMVLMRVTGNNYKFIFWISAIPPLVGLLAVLFFIKDSPSTESNKPKESKQKIPFLTQLKQISRLDYSFWSIIIVASIFMLSNYSGAYRILHAAKAGFALSDVSLVMVVQNIGIMLAAFPIGRLSDRFNKQTLLASGFLIAIISNLSFCLIPGTQGILLGSALWGIQMGATQSILLSMIADSTPKDLRGSGFGIYYLANAFAMCFANVLAGWLFESYGSLWAFGLSAVIAGISLVLIPLIRRPSEVSLESQ